MTPHEPQAADVSDDHDIDQKIGILLRTGMYAASAVIAVGGVLFLMAHGHERPDYRTFQSLPPSLRSPMAIVKSAFRGQPMGIMQTGMLLLIATPVARVAFSLAAFVIRKDKMYVLISAIVLGVLCYSLILH